MNLLKKYNKNNFEYENTLEQYNKIKNEIKDIKRSLVEKFPVEKNRELILNQIFTFSIISYANKNKKTEIAYDGSQGTQDYPDYDDVIIEVINIYNRMRIPQDMINKLLTYYDQEYYDENINDIIDLSSFIKDANIYLISTEYSYNSEWTLDYSVSEEGTIILNKFLKDIDKNQKEYQKLFHKVYQKEFEWIDKES